MKILLVANMYPSKKYPHYGVFVKNSEDILLKMENISIKRITMKKTDNKILRIILYISLYARIVFFSVFGDYDVLYGHFLSHIAIPILVLRKFNKKIKIIVNVHGNDVVPDRKKDIKWMPYVKKALLFIDHIIVPSDYFKSVMIDKYDVYENQISIFPSGGVNREVFFKSDKSDLEAKFKFDYDKRYIGFVSRIEKNKGWDIFLQAVSKLLFSYDIGIIIVGDGEEIKEFENLISELKIEKYIIRFNLLSQNEIAEIFNNLDIFCFPTYRESESLGLVGIEAMACETIVIASDRYGPSTYMKNEINGFTFSSGDANSLLNCIIKVLNLTEDEKKQIKINALKTVDEYDKDFITEKLINIFEKLR